MYVYGRVRCNGLCVRSPTPLGAENYNALHSTCQRHEFSRSLSHSSRRNGVARPVSRGRRASRRSDGSTAGARQLKAHSAVCPDGPGRAMSRLSMTMAAGLVVHGRSANWRQCRFPCTSARRACVSDRQSPLLARACAARVPARIPTAWALVHVALRPQSAAAGFPHRRWCVAGTRCRGPHDGGLPMAVGFPFLGARLSAGHFQSGAVTRSPERRSSCACVRSRPVSSACPTLGARRRRSARTSRREREPARRRARERARRAARPGARPLC